MHRLTIVNPVAIPQGDTPVAPAFPLAERSTSLDGLRVGLFWNGKNQGDVALARTREDLAKTIEGVTFRSTWATRAGSPATRTDGLRDRIVAECDVLVGTTADCGTCTSWLIREMAAFERLGVPTVGWVAIGFDEDARWAPRCSAAPTSRSPSCRCRSPTAIRSASRRWSTTRRTGDRGAHPPPPAERARPVFEHLTLCADDPEIHVEAGDLLGCFDAMNARFVANGWSDGLPLVPPTREKVDAMVEASGRAATTWSACSHPGWASAPSRRSPPTQ